MRSLAPRPLDLGVVLLGEPARAEHARAHLQAAHDGLHGHPRAPLLALALARADEHDRALEARRRGRGRGTLRRRCADAGPDQARPQGAAPGERSSGAGLERADHGFDDHGAPLPRAAAAVC